MLSSVQALHRDAQQEVAEVSGAPLKAIKKGQGVPKPKEGDQLAAGRRHQSLPPDFKVMV